MKRQRFSREYKLEAVKLVRERGVSVAQVARDLDVHENMLRKWVKEFAADPQHAFPGEGQMRPEQISNCGLSRGKYDKSSGGLICHNKRSHK